MFLLLVCFYYVRLFYVLFCSSLILILFYLYFFFFKQKPAYEMRISDWSSDVCSSDLFVYAGDLLGNVWKFDLSDAQDNKWDVANSGNPMFVAKDAGGNRQPITGGVSVALHPVDFSTWVFFGTGRFLSAGDLANKDTQSMYGLIDAGAAITGGRSDLAQRKIVSLGSNSGKVVRSEEHTSELQSLMRISYAVFCLKK